MKKLMLLLSVIWSCVSINAGYENYQGSLKYWIAGISASAVTTWIGIKLYQRYQKLKENLAQTKDELVQIEGKLKDTKAVYSASLQYHAGREIRDKKQYKELDDTITVLRERLEFIKPCVQEQDEKINLLQKHIEQMCNIVSSDNDSNKLLILSMIHMLKESKKGYLIRQLNEESEKSLISLKIPNISNEEMCGCCQETARYLIKKDPKSLAVLLPCCNNWICFNDFCNNAIMAQNKDLQVCLFCRAAYSKQFRLVSLLNKDWAIDEGHKKLILEYHSFGNLYGIAESFTLEKEKHCFTSEGMFNDLSTVLDLPISFKPALS